MASASGQSEEGGRVLVLGVGNPLLSDDTAGLHAVRMARERYASRWENVRYATHTGDSFDLLYEIADCGRLILVDSICTGQRPAGTCHLVPADSVLGWASGQMLVPHSLDLPALFRLGTLCGLPMPVESVFLGIEGTDFTTFCETPTAPVEQALGGAVDRIGDILSQWVTAKESL